MITARDVYKLQTDYNVAEGVSLEEMVEFSVYLDQCRVYIGRNKKSDYADLDSKGKYEEIRKLIVSYIDVHKVKVSGYLTKDGRPDSELLLEDLTDSIMGFSVLKEALEDPEVDEIQINDKDTIYVARGGVLEYYVDKRGRVKQFEDNDEIQILLNHLIEDGTGNSPQFTDGNPLLNAKTAAHQYRVNAVHHVANSRDKPPYNLPITTVTIRKFKEVKLTIEELVKYDACTAKMGRLLGLLGRAELKVFCVGPTGSGKTTLLNIIAGTTPLDKRIILVQNPTEISFFERDEYNRNKRNVVHWEVFSSVEMDELISNTLRATPEVIIIGEARIPEEFAQINRAMRTGHKVLGTFHADDSVDAIGRFGIELSSAGGGMGTMEAMRLVAGTIDIIIAQYKFPDGRRRVMEIAEIQGVDELGETKVNKLFEFQLSGKTRINPKNGLVDVLGEFVQVGTLSNKIKKEFFKAGIDIDEIQEFLTLEEV